MNSTAIKPERLPIFLRAHTAEVQKPPESPWITANPPQWPKRVLLFDVETRTSIDERFMVGFYRILDLVDGQYRCSEEGIVHDELSEQELNAIRTLARNYFPDIEVASFPPRVRFKVHVALLEFMESVFFPALRDGWLIAGFNLPFDLSRFSLDWRKTRKGGFALIFSKIWWRKTQNWIANPYRPTVNIEPKDGRTAFISSGTTKVPAEWPNQGRLLDIGTLLFALFDQHRSLRDWCRYFREERKLGWVHEKLDHEPSGRVTLEELQYCRRDVQCTQDLLNCAKAEFDLYGLGDLLPDKAYSPASLGKDIFRAMGISRPSEKFEIPHELQGVFMQTYLGGRAEDHLRKVRVPVMRLDFLSQYPTVNTLMGNWDILTAEGVTFPECTDEIRQFLHSATPDEWLDKCFVRDTWPQLRFFALVLPDDDIFPVRAPFDPKDREHLNIADSRFSSEKPVWFGGPEIVASIIRTGRVPNVLKAVRIIPHGHQPITGSLREMSKCPANGISLHSRV